MDGVIVNGPFDAAGLQVGESLLMRSDGKYVATLRDIFLGGAKIDGGFDMTRARVAGNLNAPSARVGGSLNMQETSLNEVILGFARVDGNLNMIRRPRDHPGGRLVVACRRVPFDELRLSWRRCWSRRCENRRPSGPIRRERRTTRRPVVAGRRKSRSPRRQDKQSHPRGRCRRRVHQGRRQGR